MVKIGTDLRMTWSSMMYVWGRGGGITSTVMSSACDRLMSMREGKDGSSRVVKCTETPEIQAQPATRAAQDVE